MTIQEKKVRVYIGLALMASLSHLAKQKPNGEHFEDYYCIPKNEKLFYDIIIRNCKISNSKGNQDIAIQFKEVLVDNAIEFSPVVELIDDLSQYFGHTEIEVKGRHVLTHDNEDIYVGYENDFVLINNELFSLKPIIS